MTSRAGRVIGHGLWILIDRAVADVYVSARDLRGGYASWDELGALSGLETSLVEREAERLILLPRRSR